MFHCLPFLFSIYMLAYKGGIVFYRYALLALLGLIASTFFQVKAVSLIEDHHTCYKKRVDFSKRNFCKEKIGGIYSLN